MAKTAMAAAAAIVIAIGVAVALLVRARVEADRERRWRADLAERDERVLTDGAVLYVALNRDCPSIAEILRLDSALARREQQRFDRCKVVCLDARDGVVLSSPDGCPRIEVSCMDAR
ncbi:MAG: hypothetical protein M3Y87_07030 [Myxococcota bacterium]|nr:hypothetical protein [Myxococcota bacterium]